MKTTSLKSILFALIPILSALASAQASACGSDVRLYPDAAKGRNAWARACGYITAEDEILLNDMRVYAVFKDVQFPTLPISAKSACIPNLTQQGVCEALPNSEMNCANELVVASRTDPRIAKHRAYARARWAEKCGYIPNHGAESEAWYSEREAYPAFSGTPDTPIDWNAPCSREIKHIGYCRYGEPLRF